MNNKGNVANSNSKEFGTPIPDEKIAMWLPNFSNSVGAP